MLIEVVCAGYPELQRVLDLSRKDMKELRTKYCLVAARTLVYGMGFGRLLYWHTLQAYRSLVNKEGAHMI